MNIDKFEEKAKEIIEENGMFVPCNSITEDINSDTFRVTIASVYEDKTLSFNLFGLNYFLFDVRATTFDDLFDKALRVLKAYGPKATRERKAKDEEIVTNEVTEVTTTI